MKRVYQTRTKLLTLAMRAVKPIRYPKDDLGIHGQHIIAWLSSVSMKTCSKLIVPACMGNKHLCCELHVLQAMSICVLEQSRIHSVHSPKPKAIFLRSGLPFSRTCTRFLILGTGQAPFQNQIPDFPWQRPCNVYTTDNLLFSWSASLRRKKMWPL